mgnify:FL=1
MKTVILDFDGTLNKACTAIKTVKDTLKEMYAMGVTLVLTSKQEQEVLENTLDELNLSNYFSVIVSADNAKATGKDNNMVQMVLEHTDSDPSQVLIVGENTEHIELGKKAGIKTCVVKCGDNNSATAGADYVINDIRALLDIV